MIKPAYEQPIDKTTLETTIGIFEKLLKLLHPFMPFITEELYHLISERKEKESIMYASLPGVGEKDERILAKFDLAKDVIMEVRNVRAQKNIPNKETIKLSIKKNYKEQADLTFDALACKLCNLESLDYVDKKVEGAFTFVVRNTEFYIPVTNNFNAEEEIKKLTEELNYTKGFLKSVLKKLSNTNFVNNAASIVVEAERKKQADAEAKIKVIEEQIRGLKK
jgi:valyl-tRNA synthetase